MIETPEITQSGRRIYGPTPPGKAVWCARTTPLTPVEVEETVDLVAQGRLARRSVQLPERLWTRHWDSLMTVVFRLSSGTNQAGPGRFVGVKMQSSSRCRTLDASCSSRDAGSPRGPRPE